METAAASSAVPFFCDELVTKILLKLPPKALFRCNCVCKQWQKLISDPSFIQAVKSLPPISAGFFYNDSTADDEDDDHGKVKYYCASDNKIYHNVAAPKDQLMMPFVVQASHYGLLLCSEDLGEERQRRRPRQFVCNPYTKEWVSLPRNPHTKELDRKRIEELYRTNEWDPKGLYCTDDEIQNKHVLLCYEKQDSYVVGFEVLSFYNHRSNSLQLYIYSSETREWTIYQLHEEGTWMQPYSFYWYEWKSHFFLTLDYVVYIWTDGHSEAHVCDLNRGSIRCLPLPEPHIEPHREITRSQYYLGMSAGSVYYTVTTKASIRIWLLHEGDRWSLEHTVSFEDVPRIKTDCFFGVIGFHPMKLVLLMEEQDGYPVRKKKKVMYDVNRREIQLIPVFGHGIDIVPFLLPSWLPRLENSRSLNPGVLLSLHEEKDAIKEEEDPANYEEDLEII